MSRKETVFVGLSGGVDSSVAALRLLNSGYNVIGVFIKVWQPDFLECDWERERLDAMRVAAHLGIPFLTFDAEEVYKREVGEYMIREYREGRTPNPDVMCNEHVKFGAFLEFALSRGADKVATGHYAQIRVRNGRHELLRGHDPLKDQSYFLWSLQEEQLKYILFPIGDTSKNDVRREAKIANLPTFSKKDSQGICFLGHVDMIDFLGHYITLTEGNVLDEHGLVIGTHQGAHAYTLGQRHGFTLSIQTDFNIPHYVTAKDLSKNTITVSTQPRRIDSEYVSLVHTQIRDELKEDNAVVAQFRYRQKPFNVVLTEVNKEHAILKVIDNEIEYPSSGQSCVLYRGDVCLGGGIIV